MSDMLGKLGLTATISACQAIAAAITGIEGRIKAEPLRKDHPAFDYFEEERRHQRQALDELKVLHSLLSKRAYEAVAMRVDESC